MTESGGILIYLVIAMVLFLIVLVFMFVGLSRIRNPQRNKEPVVGTDNKQSATNPQKLHARHSEGAMDEDVGGNLEKVPEQARESRREVS